MEWKDSVRRALETTGIVEQERMLVYDKVESREVVNA